MYFAKHHKQHRAQNSIPTKTPPGSHKPQKGYAFLMICLMAVLSGIAWNKSPNLHNPGALLLLCITVAMLSRMIMLILDYLREPKR